MELDPRLHFVTVTGIIAKRENGAPPKFLIAKRAPTEKAFPNKWTVPGGKLVRSEYETLPSSADFGQWYRVVEWVLKKEIKEEVNVEIEQGVYYLTDLTFIRPDGYPVVTLSYWCWYKAGEAKPGKDLTEVAWVTAEEAKTYDMIHGISDEIADVADIIKEQAL